MAKETLLDLLYDVLPAQLLGALSKEAEQEREIPAAVFTEARRLLQERRFVPSTSNDTALQGIFEAIPRELDRIIRSGSATASHFTEVRRMLEEPIFYNQRTTSKKKVEEKRDVTNLLVFDPELGEVIAAEANG